MSKERALRSSSTKSSLVTVTPAGRIEVDGRKLFASEKVKRNLDVIRELRSSQVLKEGTAKERR